MTTSMYQARARLDMWLADRGYATSPVEYDAHDDEGVICVYVYAGANGDDGTCAEFVLPPGWEYDRMAIEQFFARDY